MLKALLVFVALIGMLSSCTYQQTICPAYQSAYIHDQDALRKKFSYFQNDTVPKMYAANKSKFLIIEPTTYKKKVRTLQTVEQKAVPVLVPDSLKLGYVKPEEDFSMAERNVNDSTAVIRIDTLADAGKQEAYQITKEKELLLLKYDTKKKQYWVDTLGYNSEQDNYMWYLRHVLVLPDAKLANAEAKDNAKEKAKPSGKAKRKKGNFFKNLFAKHKADSTEGFEGTTSATILPGQAKADKKVKKKKEKKIKVETPDPVKKEEENEDDGF
jgi:hypothetical protein